MQLQNVHVPTSAIVTFVLDVIAIACVVSLFVYNDLLVLSYDNSPIISPVMLAIVVSAVFAAFTMGLYQREFWVRNKLPQRLIVAFAISVIVASVVSRIGLSSDKFWIKIFLINCVVFCFMLLNRLVCGFISQQLKTSVFYLGPDSGLATLRKIERSLKPSTFEIAGTYPFSNQEDDAHLNSIFSALKRTGSNEIVVGGSEEMLNRFALRFLGSASINATILPLSAFIEQETRKLDINDPEAARQLTFYSERRTRLSMFLKRVIDIVFALALLAFTLPLTALVCILILVMEGRPIFYHQDRVGLGGRVFTLFKFRSMSINAEADGVARWASKGDGRVTPIGRFLRISRIDEIPQLFNVVRGDMTLVGPRPERPSIVAMLENKIPLYAARHSATPGVTGWAQINYPYGASVEDAAAKTCYDLYYIKNSSLLLDIAIILQTVRVILLGEGSR